MRYQIYSANKANQVYDLTHVGRFRRCYGSDLGADKRKRRADQDWSRPQSVSTSENALTPPLDFRRTAEET